MNCREIIEKYSDLKMEFDNKVKSLKKEAEIFVDNQENSLEERLEIYEYFDMGRGFDYVSRLPEDVRELFEDEHQAFPRYQTIDLVELAVDGELIGDYEKKVEAIIKHRLRSFENDY